MKFSHKQASEQIARIYGVENAYDVSRRTLTDRGYIWVSKYIYITQDLGALMELAIRNFIMVDPCKDYVSVGDAAILQEEQHSDHNNDPIEATRVSIAKALIKKEVSDE